MDYILASVLALSASANFLQLYLYRSKLKKAPPSASAEEILGDLLRGQALLRVIRVAPESVLLRSPRT